MYPAITVASSSVRSCRATSVVIPALSRGLKYFVFNCHD